MTQTANNYGTVLFELGITKEIVEKTKEILAPIARYLKETPDRVPFADWYDAGTGKNQLFRNRSVQGGIFILLLLDSGKLRFPDSLCHELP